MPDPSIDRSASATQAHRCSGPSPGTTASWSELRARLPRKVTVCCAELLGDVDGDPLVRGGGGGEHRRVRRQGDEVARQPLVVGAEVEPPVGDAVGLVDDDHPGGREQRRQARGEARVGEALGGDEQHVEPIRVDVARARRPTRRGWWC